MSNGAHREVADTKLSVAEVSFQLGVEEKTVRNWMAKGQIPYMKILDGAVRIRQSVVDKILVDADQKYLEKKGVRPAAQAKKEKIA